MLLTQPHGAPKRLMSFFGDSPLEAYQRPNRLLVGNYVSFEARCKKKVDLSLKRPMIEGMTKIITITLETIHTLGFTGIMSAALGPIAYGLWTYILPDFWPAAPAVALPKFMLALWGLQLLNFYLVKKVEIRYQSVPYPIYVAETSEEDRSEAVAKVEGE